MQKLGCERVDNFVVWNENTGYLYYHLPVFSTIFENMLFGEIKTQDCL